MLFLYTWYVLFRIISNKAKRRLCDAQMMQCLFLYLFFFHFKIEIGFLTLSIQEYICTANVSTKAKMKIFNKTPYFLLLFKSKPFPLTFKDYLIYHNTILTKSKDFEIIIITKAQKTNLMPLLYLCLVIKILEASKKLSHFS